MSLTIHEVLENADHNLRNGVMPFQVDLAKDQLHNALNLLNQGMTLDDDFDEDKLKTDEKD